MRGAVRRGTVLLCLAALLGVVLVVLGALSLRGGQTVSVRANVLATGRGPSAIIDASNSPTVVVNPVRPDNLVLVNRVDRPRFSGVLHWSGDGGRSWSDTVLPLPAGRDRPYAPDAVFDPEGVLYVLYVNLEGAGNDPQTVWLARSHDGGRTLGAPVAVAGRLSFQAQLAVDGRGHVYVTWLHAAATGTLTVVGAVEVVCATSDDGGATFGPPVTVSDPQRSRVGAATPVVDAAGNLDVLYEDFTSDVRDFENLDGPPWPRPFALVLSRSTTAGRSFTPGVQVDADLVPTDRFLVYLPPFTSIAAAADGSLYVTWADGRSGSAQVYLRRSVDGGRSWSTPVRVSTVAAAPGTSAWLPRVSTAPDGRVDVVFLAGQDNSGDGLADAYLATSSDHATSFVTVRLSSSSFDTRIGPVTGPAYLAPDLGSKLGIESADDGVVAAWVDTRLGSQDTGRQDIETARVDITATGVPAPWLAGLALLFALVVGAAVPGPAARLLRRQPGDMH